jgi:hypothetical protein
VLTKLLHALLLHYYYNTALLLQGYVKAGYFAKRGAYTDTPSDIYISTTSHVEYQLIWPTLTAGPCPAGHYCSGGSGAPEACPAVRVTVHYYLFAMHYYA